MPSKYRIIAKSVFGYGVAHHYGTHSYVWFVSGTRVRIRLTRPGVRAQSPDPAHPPRGEGLQLHVSYECRVYIPPSGWSTFRPQLPH